MFHQTRRPQRNTCRGAGLAPRAPCTVLTHLGISCRASAVGRQLFLFSKHPFRSQPEGAQGRGRSLGQVRAE